VQPASYPPPTWRDRLDLIAAGVPPGPARVGAVIGGLVVAVIAGWLFVRTPPPPAEDSLPRARPAATSTTAPAVVVAHAAGAVRNPGVYRLDAGARVADLLAAAGGALPDADLDRVNLAAKVIDGVQVYVPRRGEAGGSGGAAGSVGGETVGPVNLNTATLEQLDALPGVGPATAKAILDARTRLGGFASVEDLLDVRGIGPAKLDAIRDLVTV
jgi:competence protein ComEA